MTNGKVWLVGAGPGDPGLITVAGLERLREADVILYDRLASPRLLEHARPDAELIFVGKVAGKGAHDQGKIDDLLVEKGLEGKRVVRLKGGDPFVFGRGGEEAEALRAAGVPFEVVPGVTSAAAVPAYAGIPVTHRGLASTFAVVTGHEDPGKDESAIGWGRLATAVDTLVLLMGVKTLPETVDRLIEGGRPADTPVAVIQSGTTPDQRTVTGTLADIVRRVREAGITPPAITVVGEVVRLRETLAWFEDRPLFGKRVLITRTRRQASALARLLVEEGAVPIELPTIEIEPAVDEAAAEAALKGLRAGAYAWVVFTSANGVEVFSGLMRERGLDARAFAGAKAAAIGPATAEALAERGITADAIAAQYVAEGVVEALRPHLSRHDRVLLPRAESARPELVEGLSALGARVDEVILYRAAVPREPPAEALSLLREGGVDIVTFTSSSTVRNLAALLGDDVEGLRKPLVACIGPITAKTARDLGLRVDVEAAEHTIPGLLRAIREHFGE
ncbi:MAG: uroporphyrinogen-III C-methyltransferase [Planctomycetota bacterium]|jgi:uroporphyrinogen III methyltransferase/synthase